MSGCYVNCNYIAKNFEGELWIPQTKEEKLMTSSNSITARKTCFLEVMNTFTVFVFVLFCFLFFFFFGGGGSK